jgi:serine/threonine protein kinase
MTSSSTAVDEPLGGGVVSQRILDYIKFEARTPDNGRVLLKKPLTFSSASIARFKEESVVLRDIGDHPHIQRLISFVIDETEIGSSKNKTLLRYEFVSGESIFAVLMRSAVEDEIKVCLGVANALSYMHSKGFMHRDIKSSNVFIDSGGVVRLVGLDLACSFRDPTTLLPETGSYRWMAPEVIRHLPYDNLADVYSFGIFMWELSTREIPYADLNAVQAAYLVAKEGLRPYMSLGINPRTKALMSRCWHAESSVRPTFEDIETLLPSLRS